MLGVGLSEAACSLIVGNPDDYTYDLCPDGGGRCPDGGMDAAVEDAGPPQEDAGFDAGSDAGPGLDARVDAGADGGPCGACSGDTPYCDPMAMACVACVTAEHGDDDDYCTADRCGIDFACRHDVAFDCVAQVEAGRDHTCSRLATGAVSCWGGNIFGQLGIGTSGAGTDRSRPTAGTIADAVQLTVGYSHSCVLRVSGGVSCWGFNRAGGLGQDPSVTASSAVPLDLVTGAGVVEVVAGRGQTCVRFAAGTVRCWGPALANGSTADSFTGVDVVGITDAVALSAGGYVTCAVRSAGTVACWGRADLLGDGVGVDSAVPVAVAGLSDAVDVSAGFTHVCVLRAGGAVACWGQNEIGALGDGTRVNSLFPVPVTGLADAAAISMDGLSCAIRDSGQAVCWGSNFAGQLGEGTMVDRDVPGPVNALSDAVYLSAGGTHACARRASGRVVCWGFNGFGQIGDGTTTNRTTPVTVF